MSSIKSIFIACMALTTAGLTPTLAATSQSLSPRAAGVVPQGSLIIVGTNLMSPTTPQPIQPLVSVPSTSPTAEQQNRGLGIGQQGTGNVIGQQGSTLTTPPVLPTPAPAITPQSVQPAITPQVLTPALPPQSVAPVAPLQGRGLGIGQQGSGTSIGQQGTTLIGPQGNGTPTGQQGITPVFPTTPPPPASSSDQGNSVAPNNNASSPNGTGAATGFIVPNTSALISRQQTLGSFNPPQGAIILVGPQTSGSGSAQTAGTAMRSQMRPNSNVGRSAGAAAPAASK